MIRGKLTVLGAAVVAAALLTAACSSNGATAAPIASSPSDAGASTPAPKPVSDLKPAADFHFPLYQDAEHDGGAAEVTMAGLAGHPVVVNFWAPLCPPCRAEMPEFEQLWQRHQDQGRIVLGVDVGPFTGLGDSEQAIAFLEQIGITYPAGQAVSAQIMQDYRVLGMPTTVFVTRDGGVLRAWSGALNGEKLEELTSQLLQ